MEYCEVCKKNYRNIKTHEKSNFHLKNKLNKKKIYCHLCDRYYDDFDKHLINPSHKRMYQKIFIPMLEKCIQRKKIQINSF